MLPSHQWPRSSAPVWVGNDRNTRWAPNEGAENRPAYRGRSSALRWRLLASFLLQCVLFAGCITVYQPMSGLHRPVAINPDYANFADLSLTLRCLPGPAVEPAEARALCRKLARLFENQGAVVETRARSGEVRGSGGEAAPEAADSADTLGAGPAATALNIELSARLIHAEESNFLWWSRTTDYTFAEDVVIRDETGFLLVKDTLTGRFVLRMGFSEQAGKEFSRDYYAQLSQLALNAKMRRDVLREAQSSPAVD